jgi:hypothetical protein
MSDCSQLCVSQLAVTRQTGRGLVSIITSHVSVIDLSQASKAIFVQKTSVGLRCISCLNGLLPQMTQLEDCRYSSIGRIVFRSKSYHFLGDSSLLSVQAHEDWFRGLVAHLLQSIRGWYNFEKPLWPWRCLSFQKCRRSNDNIQNWCLLSLKIIDYKLFRVRKLLNSSL